MFIAMSRNLEYVRIGELLVADGYLTKKQMNEALGWQKQTNARFGEVLVELGFVREEQVIDAIARQFDHVVVDLNAEKVDPDAAGLIDFEFATKHLCLPLEVTDITVLLAISDPLDCEAVDWITTKTRKRVSTVLSTPTQLRRAINSVYVLGKNKTARVRKAARRKDFDALFEMLDAQLPASQEKRVTKGAA